MADMADEFGEGTLIHKGFVARAQVNVDKELLYAEVQDVHEPITIEGASIPELKADFARKIAAYVELCAKRGVSPFDTPDGISSEQLQRTFGTPPPSRTDPSWPHPHFKFFYSCKSKLEDNAGEVIGLGGKKIPKRLALPLDPVVNELKRRTRTPRIAESWNDRRDQIDWYARQYTANAFGAVANADPRNREVKKRNDFDFIEMAQDLQAKCTAFLRKYNEPFYDFPTFVNGISADDAQYRADFARHTLLALCDFQEGLGQIIAWGFADGSSIAPPSSGRPRLSWKHDFVVVLGELWYSLTNKRPSASPRSLFARLVETAWWSGGEQMPEVSWGWVVRAYVEGLETKDEETSS